MSFTTRQLGANRVNRMPGAPVSCNVTNYTLEEFDGVIKGTDDNHIARKIKCTNTGILNVDNTTLDKALVNTVEKNGELVDPQILITKKFLAIGGRVSKDSADANDDLDEETNGFKELQVDTNGVLSVSVSNANDIGGGGGAVTNSALSNLDKALHHYDDIPNEGQGNDNDKLLIVGAHKEDDGDGDPTYDALNLDSNQNLKVVETNISGALVNTVEKNGELVDPQILITKKFLAIGGRVSKDSADANDDLDEETNGFKELQVDTNGVLSVSVSNANDIGGGGGAVTNSALSNLDKALHEYGLDVDDTEFNDRLLAVAAVRNNTYDSLNLNNDGNLKVVDEELGKTIKSTGNGNNNNFLAMGGRKWDDNTVETNDFRELKVNEDGVLSVNVDNTSIDVNIKNGNLPISSGSLNNIANAIVKKSQLSASNNDPGHMNICATTTDDGNDTFKAVKCDSQGTLFVTNKTGEKIKVENDKLSECILTEDVNIQNSNYLRVKNIDLGEGVVMRAVDVEGGGGASLSSIQGDVTNLNQATKMKTAPRLITVDLGPDVMYITDASNPNMQDLSENAGWVYTLNPSSRGLPYQNINRPIIIISAGNNRPRINKIRISFRIVQDAGSNFVAGDNSQKLFIYGGQSNSNTDITNDSNLQIFPIEYVTFEDLMKTEITDTKHHYFHSFVIDMPMGPEIGFFSTKALNKVYVSVAIVKF